MSIRQTDRAFGLTFAAVFTIIGGVLWFFSGAAVLWPFITAGVFAILALAVPGVLLPLNRLWSWFGGKLGHINNKLILGLFLYSAHDSVRSRHAPRRPRPDGPEDTRRTGNLLAATGAAT